jgi:hypothetical protein
MEIAVTINSNEKQWDKKKGQIYELGRRMKYPNT